MKHTPPEIKLKVVKLSEEILINRFGKTTAEHTGNCLFRAFCVCVALKEITGIRGGLQAGSSRWPRLTPEQDDGKETTHTHFSYEWLPNSPMTIFRSSMGLLPEMHVWAGIMETQEIIDTSTRNLVYNAKHMALMDWPGIKPPDFFWGQRFPDGVSYEPCQKATKLATDFLINACKHAIKKEPV